MCLFNWFNLIIIGWRGFSSTTPGWCLLWNWQPSLYRSPRLIYIFWCTYADHQWWNFGSLGVSGLSTSYSLTPVTQPGLIKSRHAGPAINGSNSWSSSQTPSLLLLGTRTQAGSTESAGEHCAGKSRPWFTRQTGLVYCCQTRLQLRVAMIK